MKHTFNTALCVDELPSQMASNPDCLNLGIKDCSSLVLNCNQKLGTALGTNTEYAESCRSSLGSQIDFTVKTYCKVTCRECGMLFYIEIILSKKICCFIMMMKRDSFSYCHVL